MSNPNYISGRTLEYRVKKDYEKQGYYVIRSAGSKGAYDLVALHPKGKTILIQCKVCKRPTHVKQLIGEVKESSPLDPTIYTQILCVRVKGDSEYKKVYLDE